MMESVNKDKNESELLSLQPLEDSSPKHPMTPTTVTLGGDETIVTLQESEREPLILCPVENPDNNHPSSSHHHIPSDATLTYAALDAGGNIVLQPLKADHQTQVSQASIISERSPGQKYHGGKEAINTQTTSGPQLVVVGEAVNGDKLAYIYIHGDTEITENDTEIDAENAHTITLNSADGSTLHTLPASYTQHLEHTYGDLVLVNSSSNDATSANDVAGRVSDNITDIPPGESNHQDDPLLLLSVQSIKLEDQSVKLENQHNTSALTLPPTSQQSTQHRDPKAAAEDMLLENVMSTNRSQPDSHCLEERLHEDELATIEERLATRDSLLPRKRHRRLKSYICPICQMSFKSNYQYNTHQSLHKGCDMWQCDICKYACDTADELKQHKNSMHHDARPYKCQQCEFRFPKSLMLEDHIRSVHNKERPYSCSFCNKGFYRPHDLKMHLNLHLGIKSNVCHVCGRQFSHPSNLIRHQRLHTGIKPYVCPTCGKRFTQVVLLQKHCTTHEPGAGVCPQCPSTFRSAAGLRKHYKFEHKKAMTLQEATRIVRGHGAKVGRRYYCQVCGNQFLHKSDLKKHEEKEHGSGKELHCPSCDKVFTAANVKSHICRSVEEEEKRHDILPDDPQLPSTNNSTSLNNDKQQNENFRHSSTKEVNVEEEYLVMYITPEGESVSYVMKKGEEGSLDKVLQINAPIGEHLGDDSLQRSALPEETIMINVQDRPVLSHSQEEEEHSLLTLTSHMDEDGVLNAPNMDHSSGRLPNSGEPPNSSESIPLQSIKLEPQPAQNNLDISRGSVHDSPLLPVLQLNISPSVTKVKNKLTSRSIAMKRNSKEPTSLKNENSVDIKEEGLEGETVLPLTCKDCGKCFQKRWNYQQHIATHDASLHRYKCDTCSVTFAYRSTYTTHMKKHFNVETIFLCQLCKKTYKSAVILNQHHKRDHMQVRPHSCDLCQKDFYSKSDYKYHMRVHNKEHPYICFACGRNFTHVSHLHRHERTHTGERPHKCPYCPKEFIQLVTLRIHLKKHEKEVTEEQDALGTDGTCPDTVEVNLGLGHDLPEDTSQMAGNVTESVGDTRSNLVVTHSTGDSLHDSTGADLRLGRNMVASASSAAEESISVEGFPPGTVILAQGEIDGADGTHQFTSDPTAVVTGMDGDCIAIFVQENLN